MWLFQFETDKHLALELLANDRMDLHQTRCFQAYFLLAFSCGVWGFFLVAVYLWGFFDTNFCFVLHFCDIIFAEGSLFKLSQVFLSAEKKNVLMLTQILLGSQRLGQEFAPGTVLILGVALGKLFYCCKLLLHLYTSVFDT